MGEYVENEKRIAILIDGDCGLHGNFEEILTKASIHGKCYIKRVYGDITKSTVKPWVNTAKEYSIQLVNVINYTSGKDSTDSALIVDAMELLFTNKFDILCLVAGDSDYISLIQRIQQEGKYVYGYGLEKSSQKYLISACDKFEYLQVKDKEVSTDEKKISDMSENELFLISYDNTHNEDGYANVGTMKNYLYKVRSSYKHNGTFSNSLSRSGLFLFSENKQYAKIDEKAFLKWIWENNNTDGNIPLSTFKQKITKYYSSYDYDEKSFSSHLNKLGLFTLNRHSITGLKSAASKKNQK